MPLTLTHRERMRALRGQEKSGEPQPVGGEVRFVRADEMERSEYSVRLAKMKPRFLGSG